MSLFRLTTPLEEAHRQAELFDFSWAQLGLILGILLLTWLVAGHDYWKHLR